MRTPDDVYDEWLVTCCQSGDERAWGELVSRWQERLLRHAARLTGEADSAADVMQDAWVAILRGLRRLDDPACFRRWAYLIVTHKCADAIRERQQNRAALNALAAEPQDSRPAEDDSQDDIARLRAALRQLPAEVRTLLAMCYLDGLSLREIAVSLALPEGTVKSRLYYARQELKQLLERNEP
jgi:RNA polymerase sigma-70 factor (ECF subfamily)